jgi:dienelactone hydrolase
VFEFIIFPGFLNHKEDVMSRKLILGLFVIVVLFVGIAARPAMADENGFSEDEVVGHSRGNHRLDCYIVRPWEGEAPDDTQYPVIVWANGWGGNNVAGETTTQDWYAEMLQGWAVDGPYIVIAANAWSAREDDVLKCLQWLVDQNDKKQSDYEGAVDTSKIGLAGHSQGAGAVVKAGDGEPNGFDITTVLAMNPYGPSWVSAGDQDGPVMVLTGFFDDTTPYSWTYPVFEAQQATGNGGIYAVHAEAGHSNLNLYQDVVYLWWQFQLNGDQSAGTDMKAILDAAPWDTQYTGIFPD